MIVYISIDKIFKTRTNLKEISMKERKDKTVYKELIVWVIPGSP